MPSNESRSESIEEDMQTLDIKLKQLKLGYEQYFLGSRPREPHMLRRDVDKLIVLYANQPIQNTALRFKFNSLSSRYNAYKRQWDETLRKIDQGTYERHVFKANLHRGSAPRKDPESEAPAGAKSDSRELYDAYVEARQACGQDIAKLSPERLKSVLDKQAAQLASKHGSGDVRFKVVVEKGKAVIRASRE